MKREVDSRLNELGSPFAISKTNEGRIVGHGPSVKAWLLSGRVKETILLKDERKAHVNSMPMAMSA